MSEPGATAEWHGVANDAVWRHIRTIFLGSLLVFLINIGLGFLNVVTAGEVPHWQLITHIHGATLGWITLSVIGFTIWVFTGDRTVSETYARRVKWLAWSAVIFGAGYVLSFGVAFNLTGNAYALLPVFGTGMMLVIWATALLAFSQYRHLPVLRTVHLLLIGALSLASVGAILGVLLGLEHALGSLPLPEGIPNRSAHITPMDAYVVIAISAVIEWLVDRDGASAWTWPGMLQAGVWTIAGFLAFVGALGGIMALQGIGSLAGFILGPLIFFARIGWRAVAQNPLEHDSGTWAAFAPVWLLVFIAGFLGIIFGAIPEETAWAGPVVFHAYFVGYATNSLFGVHSVRGLGGPSLGEWVEPAAFWLVNLGLVAFAATEIGLEERYGAVVMGIGVLLAVATMGYGYLGTAEA